MRGLLRLLCLAVVVIGGGLGFLRWVEGELLRAAPPSSCPYSGGGPPFTLQSYEAERDRRTYLDAQRLAAHNQLFPNDLEFQLPTLLVGPQRVEDPTATIPPQLLYAIGWIESSTNQAAIDVEYGTLGDALLSFDCGYGIMQVTSSIDNDGGLPDRYEALVGSHFAYNIAAGAAILVEKWNDPMFPLVGAHDPRYIESWYFALWGYNGWAGVNHPLHPSNEAGRAPYQCDGNRSGYPYQELVFGCLLHPPEVEGERLWEPLAVQYPDLLALAQAGGPLHLDVFYEGLDEMYVNPVGGASAFAAMHLPLPAGAQPQEQAEAGELELLRSSVLGAPIGVVAEAELELSAVQLEAGVVSVEIANAGSGLLAWRVVSAPSWLELELDGGVALGHEGDGPQPSVLVLESNAGGVPEGSHRGRLVLELLYPDGRVEEKVIPLALEKQGAASYEAGSPQS